MNLRRALAAACVAAGLGLGGCQDGNEGALSVVVSLPEHYSAGGAAGVAKATVEVDYSGTGARILTEGGGAACAFILPGIDGEFVDDRKGTLTIRTSGSRALRGPADIAACLMKASDVDTTAAEVHDKLLVKVASAEDAAGKPVDVAAKSPKGQGGGGGRSMSESDIEQAQEAAVKAAASAVPPPVANPTAGAQDGSGAASGATPKSPQAAAAAAASVAAAAAQKQAAAARAAPPANIPNPASAGRGTNQPTTSPPGDEGVPTDRDPSYDDSLADDKTVPSYTLEFYVSSAGRFGALQLEINHLGNAGGFIGRGAEVECVPLVDAIVASNYLGERVTKIGLISLSGVDTPRAIMRCGFRTKEPLSANSFLVEVADASDTDSKPLDPTPTVVISTILPR